MNFRISPYLIAGIAVVGFVIRAMYWYPILPDRVAIHFGIDGMANNWSSKLDFILIIGGVMLFMMMIFFGLTLLLRKMPNTLINLPNKEYWLSPEKRSSTLDAIVLFLNEIGSRTLLLLAVIFELTCRTNASDTQQLDSQTFLIVLGMYLFGVVVPIVYFVKKFTKLETPNLNS